MSPRVQGDSTCIFRPLGFRHPCYPLLSLTFLNPPTTPHPLPLFTEMEETARPCGTQSTALSIASFVQLVLSSAVTQESDSLSPSSILWEALTCALGSSEGGGGPQPWISRIVDICELVSLFQELGWLRKQAGDRWEPPWFV